jgi:uncharacterized protein YutE (UPF0331/DUF86 family)
VREAIAALAKRGVLDPERATMLDGVRKFRNATVHQPKTVTAGALDEWIGSIRQLRRQLRPDAV